MIIIFNGLFVVFLLKGSHLAKSPEKKSKGPMSDLLGSIIVDTTDQHRNHLFDLNCKICTGKEPAPPEVQSNKPKKTVSFSTYKSRQEASGKAIDVTPLPFYTDTVTSATDVFSFYAERATTDTGLLKTPPPFAKEKSLVLPLEESIAADIAADVDKEAGSTTPGSATPDSGILQLVQH